MNIKTKFETHKKVWFYDMQEINRAEIVHIDIDINGGEKITYQLERKDNTWRKYNDYRYGYLYHSRYCGHEITPQDRFSEEELAETKEELIKILKRKENDRHEYEIEKILAL